MLQGYGKSMIMTTHPRYPDLHCRLSILLESYKLKKSRLSYLYLGVGLYVVVFA